jgi:hypothetical protein
MPFAPLRAALAGALIALVLGSFTGCGKSGNAAADPGATQEKAWTSAIDEKRAFADLQQFAAIGGISHAPDHGEQIYQGRKLIKEKLKEAGITTFRHDAWEQIVPDAGGDARRTVRMENIVGIIPGKRPEAIAIGCHYDHKILSGKTFVGANDGCSGVALTLELARQLTRRAQEKGPPELSLYFVFFDGEEAFISWHESYDGVPDNCYGSRRMAAKRGDLEKGYPIETLLLLDMVGDRDLTLAFEVNSHGDLRAMFVKASMDLFGRDLFGKEEEIKDDHIPFKEAGMTRVVDLIDLKFGPGNSFWHTDADTVDKCAPESLAKVGSLLLATLPAVEAWLSRQLGPPK